MTTQWDHKRARDTEGRARLRVAWIAAGLCRDCGKEFSIKDRVVCNKCLQIRIRNSKTYKDDRVANGLCCRCGVVNEERKNKKFCKNCADKQIECARQVRKYNKEFIVKYFGGKCNGCGEVDICCLTLDHINGDGKLDRTSDTGLYQQPANWYAKLVKIIKANKYLPRELQLLCYNCHAKKDLRPWWYNG